MNKLCNILLAIVLLPQLTLAFGEPGNVTRHKQISKAYIVNPDAITSVENKYGNIFVTTWKEDKVQLDISITVSGDSESWVEKRINSIDVDIVALKSLISAETKFGNPGRNSGRNSLEINYTLHIPSGGGVKLNQQYGSISIPDLSGPASIDLQYGTLEAGNLTGATVAKLQYADKVTFKSVKSCSINTEYSKINIGRFTTLRVSSEYSDVIAGTGGEMKFTGNYGDVVLNDVKTIAIDGDYLKIKLGSVSGACQIKSEYAKIKINEFKGNWNCVIHGDYSHSDIGFDPSDGFQYFIEGEYSRATLDQGLNASGKKSGYKTTYSGTYKNGGPSLKVTGSYTSVKLHKI